MRLAFESRDFAKPIAPPPQVDGHNLVPGELESNKRSSLPVLQTRTSPLIFCQKMGIYTSLQAFRLSYEHQLSWVSSLQVAGHGTSQPPEFHEPVPHDKSPFIHIISVLFL